MATLLKAGDRVRYSQEGIASINPRNPSRSGVVVGNPNHPLAKYVNVRWDGVTSYVSYAPHFIEIDWDYLRKQATEQFSETLAYLAEDD